MTDTHLSSLLGLNYPLLLLDMSYEFVWANKLFMKLHPIDYKDDPTLKHIKNIQQKKSAYALIKEDKQYYFSIIESPFKINNQSHRLLSFFDVTKQEEQLQQRIKNEQLYKQINESISSGIILFDEKIIYSNTAFQKMSAYNATELHHTDFITMFPIEDQVRLKNICERIRINPKYSADLYSQLYNRKSTSHQVHIKLKSITIENKLYFFALITNISQYIKEERRLTQLAYFDNLTGIYNRRKFDTILKTEYTSAKKYKLPLSAMFVDIDHFKKINDIFGHDMGDYVLKATVDLVRSNLRETDIFARWGGEEFILLLPETSKENAAIYAERIRHTIETNHFSKIGNITVSIGVTHLLGNEHLKTFLKRLDIALYDAKNAGRNQVIIK